MSQTQFYGCMIIGPSGSGKSTLTAGLQQFLDAIGRKHIVISLDPANEETKYKCDIDVQELIKADDVMEELHLGPNGALVFCVDFLEKNIEWLLTKIAEYKDHYLIIDMPGQIELYMDSESLKSVIEKLQKNDKFKASLVAIELFEAFNIYDPAQYISICLSALSSMINLELPHINVLSKIDLVEQYGKPSCRLSSYTTEVDLEEIMFDLEAQQGKFSEKYYKLNKELANLVQTYSLVSFFPVDVSDRNSIGFLLVQIDKANGYFDFIVEHNKTQGQTLEALNEEFKAQFTFSSEYIMYLEARLGIDE